MATTSLLPISSAASRAFLPPLFTEYAPVEASFGIISLRSFWNSNSV